MKLHRKFLALFIAASFVGLLYLRWLALAFLYRDLDSYWSGIGSSVAATLVLLVAVSVPVGIMLGRFERFLDRARAGEALDAKERALALGSYNRVIRIVIATNIAGFFVGQTAVLVIGLIAESLAYNLPRLILTVVQAIFVGAIAALYEIYSLDGWMAEGRRLLAIEDVGEFGSGRRVSIAGKIELTAAIGLGFMGINGLCASFALISGSGTKPDDMMAAYLQSGAVALIATFVPCFLLVRIVSAEMRGRLRGLSDRLVDLGSKGDLSSRVYISMNDDLGLLISRLNGFLDQLAALVSGLGQETRIVGEKAESLSGSMGESKMALVLMKSSVGRILEEGARQNKRIGEADSDARSIAANAQDVERQVLAQSAAIEQSSAAVNELAANVGSVAELAAKAEALSVELRASSSQGETSIGTAVAAIKEIREASTEVNAIIQDIQKISSRTNLLSMNAAIEAAHAGAAGRGFAVVASEVGSLAESSARSAKEIYKRIKEMTDRIARGVEAISQAGEAFAAITEGVAETSGLIDTISGAMAEQRTGASETLKGTASVVDAIEEIKKLTRRQSEYTDSIAAAMAGLVESARAVDAALRENADNSSSLEKAMVKVESSIAESERAIERMGERIGVFNL